MRFVRFEGPRGDRYGIVEADQIREISAPPFADWSATRICHQLRDVRLLAPLERSAQMFALALNDAAAEHVSARPNVFLKGSNSLAGPHDQVLVPDEVDDVKMEAELVAVIGRRAKAVSESEARQCILGYTAGNDLTARCWYRGSQADSQWWRAKGLDTFGPLGPVLCTTLAVERCEVVGRVNGVEQQRFSTAQLRFSACEAVAFISRFATLHPGDAVWLGTAGNAPRVSVGDVVEVEVEGVGILFNTLARQR